MGIQDRDYYQGEQSGLGLDMRQQSMVVNLVIINVGIALANMFSDGWLIGQLAWNPAHLTDPLQWWHFLTGGFAHDDKGINHLLFNMLGLVFLGRDVETRMGRREFLVFYLMAVVVSSVASATRYQLMVPANQWPPNVLGASGAVVAVVVLFAFYFPKRQLLLMFILPVPAWAAALLFVLVDMFAMHSGDNVAHDVHLAGAAIGACYHLLGLRLTGRGAGRGGTGRVGKRKKPKLRVLRADNEDDLEREGDRLLEKVHQDGEESLTSRERKTLERYSRLMRRKREE